MLALVLRLPERPRWLVGQRDEDGARAVLQRVRADHHDVDGELDEIVGLTRQEERARTRGWSGLRGPGGDRPHRPAPPDPVHDPRGGAEPRRPRHPVLTGNSGREATPLIIACLIAFMLFNAGGLQLMGWLTGSETYPLAVRSAGTSAQAAALWGTNLLITLTLPSLIEGVGVGPALWLYAGFNVLAFLFVLRRMPDLTGRSLEEIEAKLGDGEFTPAAFASSRS